MKRSYREFVETFNRSGTGLKITLDHPDAETSILFVLLNGQLSETNSRGFVEVMGTIVSRETETRSFVLDLQGLGYISSSGIGAFVNILLRVEDSNAKLILLGPQRNVRSVFTVLGFSQFFEMTESKAEALRVAYSHSVSKTQTISRPVCPNCRGKLLAIGNNEFRCSTCDSRVRRSGDGLFRMTIVGEENGRDTD